MDKTDKKNKPLTALIPAKPELKPLSYAWFRQSIYKSVGEQVESARAGIDCERVWLADGGDCVWVEWGKDSESWVPISNVRNYG